MNRETGDRAASHPPVTQPKGVGRGPWTVGRRSER